MGYSLSPKQKNFPFVCTLVFINNAILLVDGKCACEPHENNNGKENGALRYKIAAIASILVASAIGVCIPLVLKNAKSLQPDASLHFLIKAFAAGVILATAFIHILPDALESLTSPCLSEKSWGTFPFTGLIVMCSCIGTLMMESFATGYHRRAHLRKALPVEVSEDEEIGTSHDDGIAHVHGPAVAVLERSNSSDLIRHRIVSQVLELGIVVHSVIIGISLGATQNSKTIRPLIAALSFHQFFEGIGLGGVISQAKLKSRAVTTMAVFFSLTTPIGIGIGIIISKSYHDKNISSLIVGGVLNSLSAGILIYMSLVDFLAADFINNPKFQSNFRLQVGASVSLLVGTFCMTLLAKWGT